MSGKAPRHAVIVQADEMLGLSTVLLARTSSSDQPATFRPVIELRGVQMRVLVEQATVVDPQRLDKSAGRVEPAELHAVDEALRLVLGL